MPTILLKASYRFFLTSGDCYEPPHIHVQGGKQKAKFWLDPVELAKSAGFKAHEVRDIERLVLENRDFFMEQWEIWCGGSE